MGKKSNFKRLLFVLLTGAALSSCVESDYDLSKDIDMTMGLGSNGLSLKLGNSEKIYLRDLLKVDDSSMLDTIKGDEGGLYYLIKDGEASTTVKVNEIPPFRVEDINVRPDVPLIPAPGFDVSFPAGDLDPVTVRGSQNMDANITDIPNEVKRIRKIVPTSAKLKMVLSLEQPSTTRFVIRAMNGLKITFPDFIFSSDFLPGTHVLKVDDKNNQNLTSIVIDDVTLDYFQLGGNQELGQLVENGEIDLTEDVKMEGTFTLGTSTSFTLKGNELVTIRLQVQVGNQNGDIALNQISGIVDPEINPVIEPIEISNDLPDFLKDESVVLKMANPTLKFNVQGQELPLPLLFSGEVKSMDGNKIIAGPVRLPVSGSVSIENNSNTIFYFYQDLQTGPFDPNGVNSNEKYLVPTLSSLIEKLPETINVNLGDGRIKANDAKLHTITLNEPYKVDFNYQVLVPFTFNSGLRIVYTDSVADMHKDLKDYEAEGITLTATAFNTVPLDLNLKVIPRGIDGQDLSNEIEVGQALIKAARGTSESDAVETPVSITITLKQPSDLKKLDKLEFKIDANSISSSELTSKQYLILNAIRLKLNGQIIADFN